MENIDREYALTVLRRHGSSEFFSNVFKDYKAPVKTETETIKANPFMNLKEPEKETNPYKVWERL